MKTQSKASALAGAFALGMLAAAGAAQAQGIPSYGSGLRSNINSIADKYVDRYLKKNNLGKYAKNKGVTSSTNTAGKPGGNSVRGMINQYSSTNFLR